MTSPDDHEVNARFADIVANWNGDEPQTAPDPPDVPATGSDVSNNPSDAHQPMPEAPAEPEPSSTPTPTPPPMPDVTDGWRAYSLAEEEDEGFVPPAPAPLPAPTSDWTFWAALLGLTGGPLLLLYRVLADPDGGKLPVLFAIALFCAGFVILVLRSPTHRDPSDDDGAVV
ncbi:hypothetical protein [Gephyromycinifex aptenodytis]|uniref:hypothetical protein n=1 Tax=Gephyromycinifex aptenodytis TaxID=2716227 RepID=UPI0014461C96|nr:hypothetical protein [Gephyromycinifex aptenodytis]